MGAEKWLDIELWDSTKECFDALKLRGYRIATTHVRIDAISIYDMDWSHPTAIVLGNENRQVLLRCSIFPTLLLLNVMLLRQFVQLYIDQNSFT